MNNYQGALGIFIAPPSIEELENRLRGRGTETEENIKKRLETAKSELENKDIYKYIVVNEDNKSREAAEEIYKIIKNN